MKFWRYSYNQMSVFRSWCLRALPLVLLAGGACNNPKSSSSNGSGPLGSVIYVSTGWTDPWSKMYQSMMDSTSKELGTQLTYQEMDGGGQAKKQIQAINEAIAKKPGVLMVSPVDASVLPSLAKAKAAGIFVFQLDRCYVPWIDNNSPANSYYGADLSGIGSLGPFQYAIARKQKGTALAIPDNSSEAGRELFSGINAAYKKFKSNLKGVVGEDCGTDEEKAKNVVAAYLKLSKPVDVIFTINDQATLGAAEAVKAAGAKTEIYGVGGDTDKVFDAVRDGSVYAIFVIPPGGPAALKESLVALQHQRTPRNSFTPSDMVDQKNISQYLKDHPGSPG